MRKYLAILKYSLKTQFTFIFDYLFSLFSFTIHVLVFNQLWDYILQGKTVVGFTKSELIWYIIIAECVTYSSQSAYKKIGEMVKQGDIANMLIKPVDVINYFLAENSAIIIKGIINIFWAIVLGITLAGPIEVTAQSVIFTLLSIIIGIATGCLLQIFCGIIAFFIEENQSFWLVLQKLSFFVVFTPLEFYPKFLQNILYFLPTTQTVYAPAKIFTKFDLSLAINMLTTQCIIAIIFYLVIRIMYKKGVEKINVNGG